MSNIRVNIRHKVANSAIRSEQRNGREVIVVPSAVAKFDSVLNGIFYPREELESSYKGIERTPAPLGHPMIGNTYAPARDPEAINTHHIGGWNERVRIEGDRIMADMVIDVEYAKRHPEGDRLLQVLNAGDPVSTSTGLYMERTDAPADAEYNYVGRNFQWDHLAILLDEPPAIGPSNGIGLMVNGEQVEVVNSELEMDDDYVTAMAFEIVDNYERKEKQKRNAGLVERIKNAVRAVLNGDKPEEAAGLQTNSQTSTEEPQMTTEELQAMLDKQAETLQANQAQAIADAVKPLQDKLDAINAEAEATAKAEKETLEATVVEAKLATEDEAKALDVNALRIMARNCKAPKSADHALNGGRLDATNSADDSKYDTLPE